MDEKFIRLLAEVHAGPLLNRQRAISKRQEIAYCLLSTACLREGGLAQLARAPALQAGGHRFDSDILHKAIDDESLTIDNEEIN